MIDFIIYLWILKSLSAPTWIYGLIVLRVVLTILGEYRKYKQVNDMKKIIQIKMDISYAVAKIYLRKFNEWKDVFEKNFVSISNSLTA